jgi:hypothetical protein
LEILFDLGPDFPLDDVELLGKRLTDSGSLVAGYKVPSAGMLSVEALTYAEKIDRLKTTILPDLNLVSRMTRVAETGVMRPMDEPTALAVNIMAFAQALNIQIEPSIAFHELAHSQGNEKAHYDLSWFRAADFGQAQSWIDMAMGRVDRLALMNTAPIGTEDLAFPLSRWVRNYIVALKIAELELTSLPPADRALRLLKWMEEDFIVAGPAVILSTMYFSEKFERRGMIKKLRSPVRQKAIDGIKNAAWDITHLSEFVKRSMSSNEESTRYIFATGDKNLARIAPILISDTGPDQRESRLKSILRDWWDAEDAEKISAEICRTILLVEYRPSPELSTDELVRRGEEWILNWSAES